MKRILFPVAVLTAGLSFVACSGSDSNDGFASGIVQAQLKDAQTADLSGQSDVFTGTLGSGVNFTFPAMKDQTYFITIELSAQNVADADEVTFDVAGDDGSGLESKSRLSGETFAYTHRNKAQHVLVVCRPRNPFNSTIGVQKLTVTGSGSFSEDTVHVNVFVAGTFTGLGTHNDLAGDADRGAFTDELMAKVQNLLQQTGIAISYEGFSYTPDQLRALNPNLLAPDDQAICSAGEVQASTGFDLVQTGGLDQWGALGFDASDPNFARGHGIDIFLIHHFTTDGNVGLSPRPGVLVGNGKDTAVGVAAFLRSQGALTPRSIDEMAIVATHEIGHFLGLLHTTTFKPSPLNPTEAIDDGLSDTPACTILTDSNGDGRVGLGDGCPDEDNIMFYQAGNQTVLTPDQSNLMRKVLSVQEH